MHTCNMTTIYCTHAAQESIWLKNKFDHEPVLRWSTLEDQEGLLNGFAFTFTVF